MIGTKETKGTLGTKGMARTFLLIATSLRSLWSLGLLGRHKITKSQNHRGWGGVITCDKCDKV